MLPRLEARVIFRAGFEPAALDRANALNAVEKIVAVCSMG
jgi:hypothetical protein